MSLGVFIMRVSYTYIFHAVFISNDTGNEYAIHYSNTLRTLPALPSPTPTTTTTSQTYSKGLVINYGEGGYTTLCAPLFKEWKHFAPPPPPSIWLKLLATP